MHCIYYTSFSVWKILPQGRGALWDCLFRKSISTAGLINLQVIDNMCTNDTKKFQKSIKYMKTSNS